MASRQLKVLLAGSDSHDLAAVQAFMANKGMAATVCTSNSEAREFIGKGDFDVILAQVTGKPSASADQVDGLGLLQLPQTPPIAVFLDFDREPSLATSAVELGAVDVLPQPLAANATAQLAMVWQHSLRRKRSGSSSELDTNDSQGSHSLSRQLALTARQQRAAKEEALIKELLPGLFDADSEAQTAARSGDQSSVATPDTPEIYSPLGLSTTGMHTPLSPFLSAELQQQSCQESDACCLDSRHDSCQFSADLDRLLGGEDLQLDIEPGTSGDLCRVLSGASLATSFDETLTEEERKAKKQKVEWTEELHRKFVAAVELLGADKAVPSKILEHMGCAGTGLTRQNIASHLQKYRNRKRSRPEVGLSGDQYAFGSTPLGLPNCWPGTHGPSPFGGLPTFVPTTDMPWGMGAAPVLPPAPAAVPGKDIRCAIQELLKKPRANPPLGLKLDTHDVLKQLNQARITIPK